MVFTPPNPLFRKCQARVAELRNALHQYCESDPVPFSIDVVITSLNDALTSLMICSSHIRPSRISSSTRSPSSRSAPQPSPFYLRPLGTPRKASHRPTCPTTWHSSQLQAFSPLCPVICGPISSACQDSSVRLRLPPVSPLLKHSHITKASCPVSEPAGRSTPHW